MINLSTRDARPIYEQVKDGLRHLVVTGAILPGEAFPSVRSLASSLAINPNTIQRAYECLEQEGYLSSQVGKGSFAAQTTLASNPRRETLLNQFDAAAAELLFLGLRPDELAQRVASASSVRRGLVPGAPPSTVPVGRDDPARRAKKEESL